MRTSPLGRAQILRIPDYFVITHRAVERGRPRRPPPALARPSLGPHRGRRRPAPCRRQPAPCRHLGTVAPPPRHGSRHPWAIVAYLPIYPDCALRFRGRSTPGGGKRVRLDSFSSVELRTSVQILRSGGPGVPGRTLKCRETGIPSERTSDNAELLGCAVFWATFSYRGLPRSPGVPCSS